MLSMMLAIMIRLSWSVLVAWMILKLLNRSVLIIALAWARILVKPYTTGISVSLERTLLAVMKMYSRFPVNTQSVMTKILSVSASVS